MTDKDLTALSAVSMRALLDAGQVSATEIARAHLARIERSTALNAFTEVWADEALAAAKRADEARARGEASHPLRGLPITIKESLDVAGKASTLGVPSRRGHRAAKDAVLVAMLREAGATIVGRTNIAQYLLSHESNNPVFGKANNPFSLAHTPGGSSGGEAAAVAAGLSALGIGTDIGGSIRVPAHFCGIVGLKPTLDRWSNGGSNTALMGQEAIRGQTGPMARTVADCAFFFRAFPAKEMSARDPRVPPLEATSGDLRSVRGLTIGIFPNDGLLAPSAAITRAIQRAEDALRTEGATVVPFSPPRATEMVFEYFTAMSAEGGHIVQEGLRGGEVEPGLAALRRAAQIPIPVRRALARVLGLAGDELASRMLRSVGERTVTEFFAITDRLRKYRFELLAAMDAQGIDAIVTAPFATPALPHFAGKEFVVAGSYAMLWNIVQFPGGIVPVTRVRAGEAHRARGAGRFEKRAAEVDERSVGLPIGVQVVARPWAEELVLSVMGAIEEAVAGDEGFPRVPVDVGA